MPLLDQIVSAKVGLVSAPRFQDEPEDLRAT